MIRGIPIPGVTTLITKVAVLLLTIAALVGCAAGPRLDITGVASGLTPSRAAAEVGEWRGNRVLWGGVIVASRNRARTSEIEVLAYPLDSSQRPKTRGESQGRFLAVVSGYVETADYGAGRALTMRGTLSGVERRYVGEVGYDLPVVDVEQLHLWPKHAQQEWSPQFHIGIGIGL
jgi:outer membrane lipoprotein